jgi:hypothetical protein
MSKKGKREMNICIQCLIAITNKRNDTVTSLTVGAAVALID